MTRLLAGGARVRCLVRREGAALPRGAEPVLGDVTDSAAVERAARGAEAVFHMAACVKTWARDASEFDRVNVEGLEVVAAAAIRAGARRILYTSSFIALGPSDGRVGDESTRHPGDRYRNDYERTKALGLARARALAAAGAPLVILLPGVVYGPGALTGGNHVAKIVARYLDRKLPGIPGSGERRWTYSYVDDVAEGHLLAAERGAPGGVFCLGGEDATLRAILSILEELTGIPAPRLRVPIRALKAIGWGEVALARLTGREPELTPGVAEIYDREWRISSERAGREIGYRRTPLREGLARTVAWVRALREGAPRAVPAGGAA